ncbi:glycoside hydrolase family 99-like domain-containing protein [Glaciimonas sp. GNP009]|uniref:glycoside hydrolase family 99-like domain-containing protein n=1 Tax=unclassified Glaciimonas TaxID=2644401 RepID=UPI002B235FDD|nr:MULTISPECIES: glycoside hydrolase family 99-like domain-containing protein [unclassified Glaciimonas]MEB0010060.1 glycoside hydrolase family 99-like domain-containing protein [Glaciimonas sp. Cout2]
MRMLVMITRLVLSICILGLSTTATPATRQDYQVGVFYFPGWKNHQPHAPADNPWDRLKAFPDKEPALGWYDEGADNVMHQQIDWMNKYGINFVVFDWYFGIGQHVYLEHALAAFMRAPNRDKLKFSILWANHDGMPKSHDDWLVMVRYWVKYYFPRPEFMRIDGRPVVYIFSADELKKQAESFGSTTKELLESAQTIARENGWPGIDFVAGSGANVPMISSYAKTSGYAAFSAYNYHQGPDTPAQSHSYTELDRGYREHWQRFSEKGNLPLIVPMTSGWDKRPWGGSSDAEHDKSISTPQEFRKHLEVAKSFMDSHVALTRRMGVICCWNEFGEGSYIEPTKKMGFSYLEQVQDVFGRAKP